MRRILAALFTCVTAIVLAFAALSWSLGSAPALTDEGTTAIYLRGDTEKLAGTDVGDWVRAVPAEFGVDVERVIAANAGLTDVYATDMTLGGRVHLTGGAWPQAGVGTNEYVASADTGSDLQVGTFSLFSPRMTVLVHPFDALDHRDSYLGELRLRTTDDAKVAEVAAYLSEHVGAVARVDGRPIAGLDDAGASSAESAPAEGAASAADDASAEQGSSSESDVAAGQGSSSESGGSATVGGGGATESFGAAGYLLAVAFQNPLLVGLLALLVFLTAFACVRYAVRESRDVAVLRLQGWGLPRTLAWYAARLLPAVAASWAVCAVGLAAVVGGVLQSPFALPPLLALDLACAAGLLAFALIVLALATAAQHARLGVARVIAGRRPFAALTATQFALKYAVLAVALVGVVQVGGNVAALRQADAANADWYRVQDVYHVITTATGENMAEFVSGDSASAGRFGKKARAVYEAMRDERGLVLADVSNYLDFDETHKLWQVNTGPDSMNGGPWWSPSGRSLRVNENYLAAWAPDLADVGGTPVRDLLVRDGLTTNVLVPEGLRQHEDEIRRLFREHFWYMKVDVGNYYARALGEPESTLAEDDLAVNLIYVPDGLSWFTYRADAAAETANRVTDSLVVVDEGEMADDYYHAWMTTSCFYPADPSDPTSPLRDTAARFDAADAYNSVFSVFGQRGEQVGYVRSQLTFGVASLVLLGAACVLCVYLFATCWFVQHRRAVMVRRLHGWPLARVCGPMLAASVALTGALALAWPGAVPAWLRAALPAADLLVTLACCWLAARAQVTLALKGEG